MRKGVSASEGKNAADTSVIENQQVCIDGTACSIQKQMPFSRLGDDTTYTTNNTHIFLLRQKKAGSWAQGIEGLSRGSPPASCRRRLSHPVRSRAPSAPPSRAPVPRPRSRMYRNTNDINTNDENSTEEEGEISRRPAGRPEKLNSDTPWRKTIGTYQVPQRVSRGSTKHDPNIIV